MAGRRRRDAVLLGVFAALQAISSVYWGVIGAVGLAVAAVGAGRGHRPLAERRRSRGAWRWRRSSARVLVAPFAWPYWQVQQREGFSRNLYEASQHEASLGQLPARAAGERARTAAPGCFAPRAGRARADRREGPEQELFPGLRAGAAGAGRRVAGLAARQPADGDRDGGGDAGAGSCCRSVPAASRPLYAFMHRVRVRLPGDSGARRGSACSWSSAWPSWPRSRCGRSSARRGARRLARAAGRCRSLLVGAGRRSST